MLWWSKPNFFLQQFVGIECFTKICWAKKSKIFHHLTARNPLKLFPLDFTNLQEKAIYRVTPYQTTQGQFSLFGIPMALRIAPQEEKDPKNEGIFEYFEPILNCFKTV